MLQGNHRTRSSSAQSSIVQDRWPGIDNGLRGGPVSLLPDLDSHIKDITTAVLKRSGGSSNEKFNPTSVPEVYDLHVHPLGLRDLDKLSEYIGRLTVTLRLGNIQSNVQLAGEDNDNGMFYSDPRQSRDNGTQSTTFSAIVERTFLTEVPELSKTANDGSKDCGVSCDVIDVDDIRLAVYPGFDEEKTTPLPKSIAPAVVIRQATMSKTGSSKFFHKYKSQFISKENQRVFEDTFWYLFLRMYHPETQSKISNHAEMHRKELEHKLFSRISENFTRLFMSFDRGPKKDEFLSSYPEILCKSIWIAFSACFPKSEHAFNLEFQVKLCDLLTEWITGIKPYVPCCHSWGSKPPGINQKERTKDDCRKREGKGVIWVVVVYTTESTLELIQEETAAVSDPLVKSRADPSSNQVTCPSSGVKIPTHSFSQILSCTMGPGSQTHRVWFDVQIITESVRRSRRLHRQYETNTQEVSRDRTKFQTELNLQLSKEQKAIHKLLNRPQLVKERADKIVDDMNNRQQRKPSKKKPASY
ncbi:hypothetical protein BJ742DRAFT_736208 [Cladochytrium replicatum]|nr:hypothetical protein BJ742DRAFT_736208 [Cladochytrium replicatum]